MTFSKDANAIVQHVLAHSTREHIEPAELRELATLWEECEAVGNQVADGQDHPAFAAFRAAYLRLMPDAARTAATAPKPPKRRQHRPSC